MPPVEWLQVRFGRGAWLDVAEALLCLGGALAILVSPSDRAWKTMAIISLATLYSVMRWLSRQKAGRGLLRLYEDGAARILRSRHSRDAVLAGGAWVSRWFAVLALREFPNGRCRRFLVCRSENHPDDYRNLLKFLRMKPVAADRHRMIW